MEPLLYGLDQTTNIVAIEPLEGRSMCEVFFRQGQQVTSTYESYKHFMFLSGENPMLNRLEGVDLYKLAGNQYYNVLVESFNLSQLYRYMNDIEDKIAVWNRAEAFMIRTGKTLFKGMDPEDPLVLAFDIETLSSTGGFSNPENDGDEVIIISLMSNKGHKVLLNQNDEVDEPTLLKQFVEAILTINPDIMIGHNVFGFDIPFLRTRFKRYGLAMQLGRNGSEPTYKHRTKKFADKRREYDEAFIYGRHVLDTELLAREVDAVRRGFDSYGLKSLIKALGKAKEDRTYVEGSQITKTWFQEPEKLLDYAMDDVDETIELYNTFSGSLFASTQFIPMSMQDVFSRGTASKIEAMFMRYYLSLGHSWARPEEKREYGGGYADVFTHGLVEGPLVYADVDSLYPSLAEVLHIQPKREELGYFQKLLKVLKAKRFELKANIKADPANKDKHKATDGAIKVYLNTMSYGYLGYEFGAFNDYGEAERITTNGQNILKKMIQVSKDWGGRPVKVDTDGMLTTIPNFFKDADEFVQLLSNCMPEGINISNDGEYSRAILFDKKSYVLVGKDGSITTKGNTLRGRSIERFGQNFINECIDALLAGKQELLQSIYKKYKEKIENMSLTAEDIVVRKDLKIPLAEYKRKLVGQKNFNAQPQYEVALKHSQPKQVGDSIAYYIKQPPMETVLVRNKEVTRPARLSAYEKAEPIENYAFDYDSEHYLKRLVTHLKRFMSLYTPDDFIQTFGVKLYAADRRKYQEYENCY